MRKRFRKWRSLAAMCLVFAMILGDVYGTGIVGMLSAGEVLAYGDADYDYVVVNGKAKITGYHGNEWILYIPGTLGGYQVNEIGEYAFANYNDGFYILTIPSSVVYIDDYAFYNCDCQELFIYGQVYLGRYAFAGAVLVNVYLSPYGGDILGMDETSFFTDEQLEERWEWDFPGYYLMMWGNNNTFAQYLLGCYLDSRQYVYFPYQGRYDLDYNSWDYTASLSVTSCGVEWVTGGDSDLIILANYDGYWVTNIRDMTLCDDDFVTSLTIKDNDVKERIDRIGSEVCYDCDNLTDVFIPSSVIKIGKNSFLKCDKLTITGYAGSYAEYYAKMNNIPFTAIYDGLVSEDYLEYSIVNGEAIITGYKPLDAQGLTLCIPEELDGYPVTGIADYAFEGSNVYQIIIPSTIKNIGYDALYGHIINVFDDNPYYSSERGVLYNKDKTELISYTTGGYTYNRMGSNFTVPNSVKVIKDSAFSGEYYLDNVTLPSTLETIEDCAFNSCSNLRYINIPNSVTSIGANAFAGCSSLTSITIPDSITRIENGTFFECGSLNKVTIPKSVRYIGRDVFYNSNKAVIYGYANSYAESYALNNSIPFVSIDPHVITYDANGGTGAPASQTKKYGIPIFLSSRKPVREDYKFLGWSISKDSDVVKYNPGSYYNNEADLTLYAVWQSNVPFEYYISDGEVVITGYTGNDANPVIPNTIEGYPVVGIDDYAFDSCTSIESIGIPAGIKTIGTSAFIDCTKLTSINVAEENENYASIDGVLFNKSKTELIAYPTGKADSTYEIPSGVTTINEYAFMDNDNLTRVIMPDSVTNVESCAFNSCTNIREVSFSYNLKTIGANSFAGCSSLKAIEIPESTTSIGVGAFFECVQLETAVIPKTVTAIGRDAFYDCDKLTIKGYKNSYAKTYANNNKINFYAYDECTIYYDANGGSGEPKNQIKGTGESVEISSIIPVKEGYVFLGWANFLLGDEVAYNPGDVYSLDDSIILFAVWKAEEPETEPTEPTEPETQPTEPETEPETQPTEPEIQPETQPETHPTEPETEPETQPTQPETEPTEPETEPETQPTEPETQPTEPETQPTEPETQPETQPEDTTSPQIVVQDVKAKSGENFTVDISMKNNPGIIAFSTQISYSKDILELVGAEAVDLQNVAFGPLTGKQFNILWSNALNGNMANDVTMARLTFKVKDGIQDCTTPITITYDEDNIFNSDWDNVAFKTVDGTVTVLNYVSGDTNGDGKVNMKDYALLQQYLNGWEVTINPDAADVTGDGKVNMKDLALLQQYLGGWDVELK